MNARYSLLAIGTIVAVSYFGSETFAQELRQRPFVVKQGKELFHKQWEYSEPTIPTQGDLSRQDYAKALAKLPGDGLGPMHNAASCAACHEQGGASGVDHNVTLITVEPRSPFFKKGNQTNSRRRTLTKESKLEVDELFPGFFAPSGSMAAEVVVHEKSTRPFYDLIRRRIADFVPGGIADEWFLQEKRTSAAIGEQPVIAGRKADLDFYLSQRNSPPLFGLGLIDRVPMTTLERISRAQKTRGKVSGRIGVGKFGWRAQTPSLDGFVRGACAGELGLAVPGTLQPNDRADDSYVSLGVDMSDVQVTQLAAFVRSIPKPVEVHDSLTRGGRKLFASIGCADCHVPNVFPAIGVYSDLLLHDMGAKLQAPAPAPFTPTFSRRSGSVQTIALPFYSAPRNSRPLSTLGSTTGYYGSGSVIPQQFALQRPLEPQFPYGRVPSEVVNYRNPSQMTWDALQREWRTPPLWGLADTGPYLHDGRAETIDSAIRWHGGEAKESAANYRSLSQKDREQLLSFLHSLKFSQNDADRQPADKQPADKPMLATEPDADSMIDAEDANQVFAAFAKGYDS